MKPDLNRRDFLKLTASGLGLFTASSLFADNQKRPNIFFAIADDWGWPHSSIYGDAVVKTPTFDRIAGNGILFNNAFVAAPSCTPSRNAILTGQYHWRLGSGANLWSRFPDGHLTYPNILEDNGYFVGQYRKAFGPGKDRDRPVAGKKFKSVSEFFQERPKDKPFCFWFGSKDPHRKYEWQSGVKSGMKLEKVQVPPCFPDSEEIRTDICDYYWEVQRFDRELGEALKFIEDAGELDNTIVIVTGDNGWPFPRGKSNLYDMGVHVPLAVQWPKRITKGRVLDDFVSLSDLAPTFLEIAGLKPLSVMTGRSLINVFDSKGSGIADPARDHVLTGKERHTPAQADNMGGTPMRAIRNKDYLYIHNFEPDRWPAGDPVTSFFGKPLGDIDAGPTKKYITANKDDPEMAKYYEVMSAKRPADELYDLKKDPHQVQNVAEDPAYASVLKKLKAQLFEELKATGDLRVLGKGHLFDAMEYLGGIKGKRQKLKKD
jgi:arylsulfatase A-like enzyme